MENMRKMVEEVIRHENLYEKGTPVISDLEFDKLYNELLEAERLHPNLIQSDSPTRRIIASEEILTGFDKVAHDIPLLSQSKVNSEDQISDFYNKNDEEEVTLELKLDGLTILLEYEEGVLKSAVTRGDGYIGYNLYENVKMIRNVPKKLPQPLTMKVRAEILCPLSEFNKANIDGEFSNARNFATGTIRQYDPNLVASRNLKAIVFEIVSGDHSSLNGKEALDMLESLNFEVVENKLFKKGQLKELLEAVSYYEEKRDSLDFEIDGLVIKLDNNNKRVELGSTSKHPRWSVAFKFVALETTTMLLDVIHQVGKTGRITPVAVLEKAVIANVNIEAATLHNYEDIKRKDIKIGDRVVLKRANDVIPQVVSALKELRDGSEKDILAPEICPSCNSIVVFKDKMAYCKNEDCIPQIKGRIEHFGSKDALDITGLGGQTVSDFVDKGIVTSILDLLTLKDKEEEILKIEKMGKKKLENILEGIEEAKSKPLNKFLYSLSIENIGRSASREIEKNFTIEDLLETPLDELREKVLALPDFGSIMADSLCNYLSNHKEFIKSLLEAGFASVKPEIKVVSSENDLSGLTFAVTGSFDIGRKNLEAYIVENGGKVSGSVSSKTSYLINNDSESDSSKNKKAKELGIEILTEAVFVEKFKS